MSLTLHLIYERSDPVDIISGTMKKGVPYMAFDWSEYIISDRNVPHFLNARPSCGNCDIQREKWSTKWRNEQRCALKISSTIQNIFSHIFQKVDELVILRWPDNNDT